MIVTVVSRLCPFFFLLIEEKPGRRDRDGVVSLEIGGWRYSAIGGFDPLGKEKINGGQWLGATGAGLETRCSGDVLNEGEGQMDSVRRISSGGELEMPRLLSKPMIMVNDETARAAPRMGHQEMTGAI